METEISPSFSFGHFVVLNCLFPSVLPRWLLLHRWMVVVGPLQLWPCFSKEMLTSWKLKQSNRRPAMEAPTENRPCALCQSFLCRVSMLQMSATAERSFAVEPVRMAEPLRACCSFLIVFFFFFLSCIYTTKLTDSEPLSVDHKPDVPSERKRIEAAGTILSSGSPVRYRSLHTVVVIVIVIVC